MSYICPVCGWPELEKDPAKELNEICPCCGNEFGIDDYVEQKDVDVMLVSSQGNDAHMEKKKNVSPLSTQDGVWQALRKLWVRQGMQWSEGMSPKAWDAKQQLEKHITIASN